MFWKKKAKAIKSETRKISVGGIPVEATIDEKGNITADYSLSLNGQKYNFAEKTTIAKITQIIQNEANPNSCEKEPDKTEVKIPVVGFFEKYKDGLIGSDIGDRVWANSQKANQEGFNQFIVNKSDFNFIIQKVKEVKEQNNKISKTAQLNQEGIELEKQGKINEAIAVYEENIKLEYPATNSYDRLMVLYRKQKDKENEIRIIKLAINVFLKANREIAERCIEKYPERSEEISDSLVTCTNLMGSNGFYILVLYNVVKYRDRLNKLISK